MVESHDCLSTLNFISYFSELRLRLEGNVAHDDDLSALFGLGGKDDVVALFPALDDKSLTREDMGCESRVDLSELLRVFRAVLLLNDSRAEAIRA